MQGQVSPSAVSAFSIGLSDRVCFYCNAALVFLLEHTDT